MSDEEAEAAFESAPEDPLSEDDIKAITETVVSGELASWDPLPELDWTQEMDLGSVEEEALQLFRNKGEEDANTKEVEDELRRKMMSDDDE